MSPPLVSIVVPTRDRPAELMRCLRALAGLDYPHDRLEVIVVDDGGSADLGASTSAARPGLAVEVLKQQQTGPAGARNRGVAAAQGDVVAFTDDDCIPDRSWVAELTAGLGEGSRAGCGGLTLNALPGNPYSAASQHIQDLVYAHYNADPDAARFLATNNLAVPRDGFLEIGGFDTQGFPGASEDRDLCDRWIASGRALRLEHAAIVHHAHALDLAGFIRQHVAYGRGAFRYHRARARRGTGRMRDDMPFHANRSLWARTLRIRPRRRAARTAGLLALWQAANAAGYLLERRAAGRDELTGE